VHGLNGDPKDTWTARKTNAFWLTDFLPRDIPNIRVMTFGYDASAAFGNTTAGIEDRAKGLLTSLVDKRVEDDVGWYAPGCWTAAENFLGSEKTNHFHRTFIRWNRDKAG
jgi:hypothetical protein